MTLTKEDLATLQFPFKANEHRFLQGKAYIREDAITERIEQIDPAWEFKYVEMSSRVAAGSEKPLIFCIMNLTIKGVTRSGVGMADVTLTKKGDDEANEAEKSAATDALKRAARLFGIGRYLLDLPPNVKDVVSLREYLVATYATTPTPQPPAATAPAVATGETPQEQIQRVTASLGSSPETVDALLAASARKQQAAEPARVSELVNEALTITRIETRSDSAGWYGYGMFNDGVGSHEVRVNLFAPEDPKAITDAGYKWVTSGKVEWPVILAIKDNRTRIGSVVPKATENAAKTIVSGFQTNLTQNGKPYLIFKYGDNYAYSYTREPFREAGYNVDGWNTVGIHEMPTPAELICSWDKQQKHLIVDRVVMVDVFEKQVAS